MPDNRICRWILMTIMLSAVSGCAPSMAQRIRVDPAETTKIEVESERGLLDERLAGDGEVTAWSKHELFAFVENEQFFIAYNKNGKTFADVHRYRYILPHGVQSMNTIFLPAEAETAAEVWARYNKSKPTVVSTNPLAQRF
jgi:hypothetical protein